MWVCNRDMDNNEKAQVQDELYYKAMDAGCKLGWITPGDYQTVEEYLEAKAEARVERDLAWAAYEDSL